MKKQLFRGLSKLVLQPWFRLTRAMTLGVRVAVFDENGRVLLIRHTYAPGWLFPGGGVERGETVYQALERELFEEAAIVTQAKNAQLVGLFCNDKHFRGDHIALFHVTQFEAKTWKANGEIAEMGFFDPNDLPRTTTNGTRRRIAEIIANQSSPAHW